MNRELKPETNNFEDIYGYYEIFVNELSRTSPYSDVEACENPKGHNIAKNPFCITQIRIRIKILSKRLTMLNIIRKNKKLWGK